MKKETKFAVGFCIVVIAAIVLMIAGCTPFQVGQKIKLRPLGEDWYEVVAIDSVHVEPVHPDSVEISWQLGADAAGYKVRIWGIVPRSIDVGLVTEIMLKMAMPDSVGLRAYDWSGNVSGETKWRKENGND